MPRRAVARPRRKAPSVNALAKALQSVALHPRRRVARVPRAVSGRGFYKGFGKDLGKYLGAGVGAMFGGPGGAVTGATLGRMVGGSLSGLVDL